MKDKAATNYSFTPNREALRHFSKLSALEKLEWLKSANDFVNLAVGAKRRELWERYRKGEFIRQSAPE